MKRLALLLIALALALAMGFVSRAAAQEGGRAPTGALSAQAPQEESDGHEDDAHAATVDEHGGGHDEPSPIATPAEGIITALSTLLVFGGLVFILGRYAWGPIVAGLKAREDKIRADIEAAERARAEANAARKQFEEQLATAEARVREMLARAQADGQQLATRLRAQAQEEAEDIKQRAIREIEQSQREALEEIRAEAATLATAVAEKILRREVNRQDQRRLIEESLDEFQTVGSAT